MSEGNTKRVIDFLKGHLLSTFFWALPILFICICRSFFYVIVFLSFYTSFTFWQWKKYQKPKRFKIYRVHWLIEVGYSVSTGIFLFLTGKYVYDGLMSNYVTHRSDQCLYVFLYAAAITIVLTTITYMIKTGRRWIWLCVVYLLFDLPGAMAFNFLHFYENLRVQNRLDIDKTLVETVGMQCNSLLRPKVLAANAVIARDSAINQGYEDATKKQLALNQQTVANQNIAYLSVDNIKNPDIRRSAKNDIAGKFQTTNIKIPINEALISEVATNRAIVNTLQPLIITLDTIDVLIRNMKMTNDREIQLVLVEDIKSNLKIVCTGSSDTTLQNEAKKLIPNEPTQLESIEAVYDYIGMNVFGLNNDDPMDKRTERLVLMSLIPSIIIDLLPLIFAIVYASWGRNNYEE